MMGMHSRYLGVALATVGISLFAGETFAQAQPAVGVVVSARSGQIGAAPATPGSTVFSGDRIVTQNDSLIIRAGTVQFGFKNQTSATLYARPEGIAIEIERGTVTFFSQEAAPGFTLFVSDLHVNPIGAQPFSGEIEIENECSAILTARIANLLVKGIAGEVQIAAGKSMRVSPENPIEQRPPGTPLGDSAFHKAHLHKGCTPLVGNQARAAGPSWFAPVLFVEAGVATAVILARPVSPH